MILFTKLLLAHLLGDFIFQSERWVRDKKRNKLRSRYLYIHFLIHGLLVFILVQSWVITGLIAGSHAAIDITKQLMQRSDNRRAWFFGDQLLHLAVIVAVAGWMSGVQAELLVQVVSDYLLEITAIVFLTMPSSVIIQMVISRWDPDPDSDSPDSLDRAGKYIGILERLFVFTFVMVGQWSALGFLIAAKSVFRFGDLKEAHDRKLTEYILIGTLLSVGIASIVGVLVKQFS
ncbi:MAG: DUF3307 domain-containing protein [Fodinibius sp.]|nr:DUF3307 domain-containing protein [Fodinibius sp.]